MRSIGISPAHLRSIGAPAPLRCFAIFASIMLAFITAGTAAQAAVEIAGSWSTGLTHAAESGARRALIFTAHHQDNEDAGSYLTAVSYGGQPLTQIEEAEFYVSPYHYYVTAWILSDSGIAAASDGNFAVTWSDGGPANTPGYSSVFLTDVDQAISVSDSDAANCDCGILSTGALATAADDLVILAATHGGNSPAGTDYEPLNGFSEVLEFDTPPGSAEGLIATKVATGANETPSVDSKSNDFSNRQSLVGFVIRADTTPPPNVPTTSTWGLLLLFSTLAAAGSFHVWRRQRTG